MDKLPAEILIRIFDKSRLSDQLVSHRLINNKFRSFIPTSASRIQRLDTTALIAMSKKLAVFSQRNSAYYHSQKHLHEDPGVERAYANLLLYVCSLNGASLKCISFTAPLCLDSATMEKLVIMCPNITEISVGYYDSRVRYFGFDVQSLYNYVYLALPRFPQLKILRIISDSDTDTSLLQPVVAQLRLQKLRTSGSLAPVLTADPSLLDELVVSDTNTSCGPYNEIKNRIGQVFPNLRRHYFGSKQDSAVKHVRPRRAVPNYRRWHTIRGSSWIGGKHLWFIEERLFVDFPYLQNINIEISDDESCARFIKALQSSTNWKALNMVLNSGVSNEKRMQLLQALFYTTAVRLKSLTLRADHLALDDAFSEQFLHFDQAGSVVVFDKTLRQCDMRGSGMLLFVAIIASACSRLKSLKIADFVEYMQPDSGLHELLRTAVGRFEQANLRSLLKLTLKIAHAAAYDIIQHLRGSKLHTMRLDCDRTDDEILADTHCLSLLHEDVFPYLRKIVFATHKKDILSDMMLSILRNLPGLQWLQLVLYCTENLDLRRCISKFNYCGTPTVHLDQAVWQHIADHANLQFCSVDSSYNICSLATFGSLCDAIIAHKKVDENGRVLPWLYTEFERGGGLVERVPTDNRHHMGENVHCFYGF